MSSTISFAQNLQSDKGQKAIMDRLAREIRVLEVLKKFLTVKIKLEKEYSHGLENSANATIETITSAICYNTCTSEPEDSTPIYSNTTMRKREKRLKALRAKGRGEKDYLPDSEITLAYIRVVEEECKIAQNLKKNCEALNDHSLKMLSDLLAEKKKLFKLAQEKYTKMKEKLDHHSSHIKKCKAEYLKQYKNYESSRMKFEESCTKGISKTNTNKKADDFRDKFLIMKRKLNLAHAEYLLAITEGMDYDKDFRTILLPGLLQIEETWCEKQLQLWTELLADIISNSTFFSTNVGFRLKQLEFSREYAELIKCHKCPPLQSSDFKFEPAQISSQPVNQTVIIIEQNTTAYLNKRLLECEKRIKVLEHSISEKAAQIAANIPSSMILDLQRFEHTELKCELDRLISFKQHIEGYLKSCKENQSLVDDFTMTYKTGSTAYSTAGANARTSTSASSNSVVGRFSTLFRPSKTLKKQVSFERKQKAVSSISLHTAAGGSINGLISSGNSSTLTMSPETFRRMKASIEDEYFYHGVLPREDVIRLLKKQGDYLVRETWDRAVEGQHAICLSVQWNEPKHFKIQTTPDGQFRFEGPPFPTVKELLEYYVNHKIPVTKTSGAIIKTPVHRAKWELDHDDIQLIEKIGKGNFGDVYKANLKGLLVAIKTCKLNVPNEQKKRFLQEARILKQYDHPNIVKFIGICVHKEPIMLVMELVIGGSLLTYLKANAGKLGSVELTSMCKSIASGMKYLEENGCLHRDLAARNCLVDENRNLKISDFGMSREEHEYTVSDGCKQIPIKWTAPEALNYGRYTCRSDVWSYGILMWEIFSGGQLPYTGMSNKRASEMVEAGYRMTAPSGMPDIMFELMSSCWRYEPEQRPSFSEIYSELEFVLNSDLL